MDPGSNKISSADSIGGGVGGLPGWWPSRIPRCFGGSSRASHGKLDPYTQTSEVFKTSEVSGCCPASRCPESPFTGRGPVLRPARGGRSRPGTAGPRGAGRRAGAGGCFTLAWWTQPPGQWGGGFITRQPQVHAAPTPSSPRVDPKFTPRQPQVHGWSPINPYRRNSLPQRTYGESASLVDHPSTEGGVRGVGQIDVSACSKPVYVAPCNGGFWPPRKGAANMIVCGVNPVPGIKHCPHGLASIAATPAPSPPA